MNQETRNMIKTDSLVWADVKKMSLRDGYVFSLKGLNYLYDIINCPKKVRNCKKGAQMCLTTAFFLDSVHACYYRRYNQNIMYMMPTVTAVERLSKVSFDPIFQYNPWIMRKGDTNTTMCREINGRSIVMVGAQPKKVGGSNTKDTDNLRSIPCDRIDRDEIDLMDQDMVYMSTQRLLRSAFKEQNNFGSPTYPGYGIDLLYEDSDQGKWQIKCGGCGKYTCLADTFPECIIQKEGRWLRSCIHCQKEIFVIDGHWVQQFPDRREAGFWVSGLLSPYADLDEYMYEYNNIEGAQMSEFMRSRLGIAATESESQLDETVVLSRCGTAQNQMVSTGETVMGVDNNKQFRVVIGIKTGRESYEILHIGRYDTLVEVHDIALKMNVSQAVIDSGPYDHGVREFQKAEPYTIYLCQYSEQMPGTPHFDRKTGMVKVNRNEWCDKVHATFSDNKVKIPRPSIELKQFAKEMTGAAKTIVTHPETGLRKPKWLKIRVDDYFHGVLYFLLAALRTSPRMRHTTQQKRPTHTVNTWN